jgi:transglutaminase-like putative cysteine protease
MRIKITHETRYHFEAGPNHLVQRLHLKPAEFATQRTIHWKISAPGIEGSLEYIDGFGNWVHLVTAEIVEDHSAIIAEGEVETQDTAGVVRGLATQVPGNVFLRQTFATMPDAAMLKAMAPFSKMKNALEAGHALMGLVGDRVAYEVGTSDAYTTAAQSFSAGRGVCQDHAQVMIGMARAMQISARYVTGYLVTGQGATAAAAHAWAELLVPDLGWVGFDAANNQCPTEHYVRLASGLDAAAVAPIKGSRRGNTGSEKLTVAVRAEIEQQ